MWRTAYWRTGRTCVSWGSSLYFISSGLRINGRRYPGSIISRLPFLLQYLGTPSRYHWKGSHQMRITGQSFGARPSLLTLPYVWLLTTLFSFWLIRTRCLYQHLQILVKPLQVMIVTGDNISLLAGMVEREHIFKDHYFKLHRRLKPSVRGGYWEKASVQIRLPCQTLWIFAFPPL